MGREPLLKFGSATRPAITEWFRPRLNPGPFHNPIELGSQILAIRSPSHHKHRIPTRMIKRIRQHFPHLGEQRAESQPGFGGINPQSPGIPINIRPLQSHHLRRAPQPGKPRQCEDHPPIHIRARIQHPGRHRSIDEPLPFGV
jgi:hypothetical protein